MSREQANTFRKFRDAEDPQGNLGWSSRMARKGMKIAREAEPEMVEREFELNEDEKVLWRIMKVARKYIDLENAGVLPPEQVRGYLRGLVSADVLDIVELDEAKPIVPIEIKRTRDKVQGKSAPKKKKAARPLKARVYRPSIGGASDDGKAEPSARPAPAAAAPSKPAPAPAPRKPSAPVSAEGQALIDNIEGRFEAMKAQNHYEFLEIQPTAKPEGIKKAYMALAKELHPDRISGQVDDPDTAAKADKLFKRLQDAWSTLNNPDYRDRYDAKLTEGNAVPGESGGKQRRPEEAAAMVFKGDHLLKAKNLVQAQKHYKTALMLDDQCAPASIGLAWCTFLDEKRPKAERYAEARGLLEDIAVKSKSGDAAYKVALIARVEGDSAGHEKWVDKAFRYDPTHKEASQERRLLERRREKEGGTKAQGTAGKKDGLFGRFKR
jgi:curved DNA-binding protein CbpA